MSNVGSGSGNGTNQSNKRILPDRKKREAVQPSGHNRRAAKHNAKASRPTRTQGPDPGEWRVNAKSAVSLTIYDISGAPLRPDLVKELEEWAESVTKRESLVLNVALG